MIEANVVIPVKGFDTGKSRLSAALADDERAALVRSLVKRTIGCAFAVVGPDATYLLSPDADVVAAAGENGVQGLLQEGGGLNEGLDGLRRRLEPRRTVVVPADIPHLDARDIRAHALVGGLGITPDRRKMGTNMLSVPRPGAIRFRFGYDSFYEHLRAARRAGLAATVIDAPRLRLDLDRPWDLRRLGARLAGMKPRAAPPVAAARPERAGPGPEVPRDGFPDGVRQKEMVR